MEAKSESVVANALIHEPVVTRKTGITQVFGIGQRIREQQQSEQDLEGENQDEERQELVNRDEKREALEQWLRRVPDEPGGLLRRKFQHETKQRLRNGEYENRQGEKVW